MSIHRLFPLLLLASCLPSPGSRKACVEELCGNGLDDDCDGLIDEDDAVDASSWFPDEDGDGWGANVSPIVQCASVEGRVDNSNDCDDANSDIHPDAEEICDGEDQDCDGLADDGVPTFTFYEDDDGDGFGDPERPVEACAQPAGAVGNGDDCDDSSASARPGGEEVWYDGSDGDCDGWDDFDADRDGHASDLWSGDDCDDANAAIHPDAWETTDEIDNNCDDRTDWWSLGDADVRIVGERDGEFSGWALASLGDVEGDLDVDLLIGAPYFGTGDATAVSQGAAYLVLGDEYEDMDLASVAARFQGENAQDRAGYAVGGPGDVNDDGFADILVGAPFYGFFGTRLSAGIAYLVFGSPELYGVRHLADADLAFRGEAASELGTSLAGAGDVNWDGVQDLLIGAPSQFNEELFDGAAYLIWGSRYLIPGRYDVGDMAIFSVSGRSGEALGTSLAGGLDLNGDGRDDMVLGAPMWPWDSETDVGNVYVFLGSEKGTCVSSDADMQFHGERANSWAGWSVARAGDVDGDACDDILVGALYADMDGRGNAGKVYLLLCPEASRSLAEADWIGYGAAEADAAGQVAGVGDVNGDGLDDFMVGAADADYPYASVGASYLVLGAKDIGGTLDLASATTVFRGQYGGDRAAVVAYAGDLDRDGFDEVMVGAPGYGIPGDGEDHGMTYLFYGRAF